MIAELKPLPIFAVIVEVPDAPLATVIALGEALRAKFPFAAAVTVRVTVVVSVVVPEVPFTVMGYVPGTVVEATVIVIV